MHKIVLNVFGTSFELTLKIKIMKKIIPYLMAATFALFSFSCTSDDDRVDYDTYSVVYDLKNVNFESTPNGFQISRSFVNPLFESDMLLVYMQVDVTNNGSPIWQQIPTTFYLSDGHEVDYNFDFSRFDFMIYAGGTFNLAGSEFIHGKTFRVLVVPAQFGRSVVDLNNYDAVIAHYNLDDSNPTVL